MLHYTHMASDILSTIDIRTRNVPKDLHKYLKKAALERSTSLESLIITILTAWRKWDEGKGSGNGSQGVS